jgi:hypothetical protein
MFGIGLPELLILVVILGIPLAILAIVLLRLWKSRD